MDLVSTISPSHYGFYFLPSPNGEYLVSKMRQLIDSKIILYNGPKIVWTNLTPLKVRCFAWRVMLGRIPVQTLLHDRGLSTSSQICVLCHKENESVNHLFLHCSFAREVQSWLFNWCGFGAHTFDTVLDFIDFARSWGKDKRHESVGITIIYCFLWCIWLTRNDKVFKKIQVVPAKVMDLIMTTSFSWCKNRCLRGCGSWADWSCSPFNHLIC